MGSDSRIALLKEAVVRLKKDGVQQVAVDALIDYVTKLEGANAERREPSAAELEHYKAQLSAWVEKQKEVSAINVEGFKSVILAGQNLCVRLFSLMAARPLRYWLTSAS